MPLDVAFLAAFLAAFFAPSFSTAAPSLRGATSGGNGSGGKRELSDESFHLTVLGNGKTDSVMPECLGSTDTQGQGTPDAPFGNDLAVTCCDADGKGSRPDCMRAQTRISAQAHCKSEGLRLCTKAEIVAGSGKGTGCSFNTQLNWVSDPCQTFHFAVVGHGRTAEVERECLDSTTAQGVGTPEAPFGNAVTVTCCSVDGKGSRPGCKQGLTWDAAKAHCESFEGMRLRLCAADELAGGSGKGTGCEFNQQLNWVSDACEKETTKTFPVAVVGHGKTTQAEPECLDSTSKQGVGTPDAAFGNTITVTCCSEDGRGSRPGCKQALTWGAALAHCESEGLRLCTKDEIIGGSGKGTGCDFNSQLNWVSDTCEGEGEGEDGDAEAAEGGFRAAVIGNGNVGLAEPECLDPAATQSTSTVDGAMFGADLAITCCDASGMASRPGCTTAVTWSTANAICKTKGLRLCTKAEVLGGAAKGKGCNTNRQLTWVADACQKTPYNIMTCPAGAALTTMCMTPEKYDSVVESVQDRFEGLSKDCNAEDCPQADWAGCVLRMAGHDFMDFKDGEGGGSDGCVDMNDADNRGLAPCLHKGEFGVSINDAYQEHCTDVSLADFLVIAAEAVMHATRATVLEEDPYKPPRRQPVDFKAQFRFGRTTAKTCEFVSGRLPNAESGCLAVKETFNDALGLDWEGSAALMGVHSLGRARPENSGYDGWWSDAESSRRFNNDYYHSILTKGWFPMKCVGGDCQKNQWQLVDETHFRGNGAHQMMLNTDLCLAFHDFQNSPNEQVPMRASTDTCCAWLKTSALHIQPLLQWCGSRPPFPFVDRQTRGSCCDHAESLTGAKAESDCGDPEDPKGVAIAFVMKFGEDEGAWLAAFQKAWKKVTENGFETNLKDLGQC